MKTKKKCCKKFREGEKPCKKCPLIVHLGKKEAKKFIKSLRSKRTKKSSTKKKI